MPLNNFGIVSLTDAGWLARCAQPDKVSSADLFNLKFDTLYKLNQDSEFPDAIEKANFKGNVILNPYPKLFKIPPKQDIIDTVNQIQYGIKTGRRIVVHCTHGRDRTGLVIGAYRILMNKWTFEMAQAERQYYGANAIIDIADAEIVEFLKQLAA